MEVYTGRYFYVIWPFTELFDTIHVHQIDQIGMFQCVLVFYFAGKNTLGLCSSSDYKIIMVIILLLGLYGLSWCWGQFHLSEIPGIMMNMSFEDS